MFELAASLDPNALRDVFEAEGRLQIAPFLSERSASDLHHWLSENAEWRLTANRGDQILDFDLEQVAQWKPEQHRLLEEAVTNGGRYNFQFRYEVVRLKAGAPGPRADFTDFMSRGEVIELMRRVTGAIDIAFADAHASRYRAGHFLTTHDDMADNMGRRAAYVLNLTPKWRPDWGGLLQFFDSRSDVARAFTPSFNALNLFSVPQPHNVSWVNPLAGAPRYAITGWLRAKS